MAKKHPDWVGGLKSAYHVYRLTEIGEELASAFGSLIVPIIITATAIIILLI
jgi:hypothetical protein